MEKLVIKFVDFYNGFSEKGNVIYNALASRYEIEFGGQPQILFYSAFGLEHLKYENCVKVFYTLENLRPNFNECDYAISTDPLDFCGRHLQNIYCLEKTLPDEDYIHRKFCNFIYFNDGDMEGCKLRKQFCLRLARYRKVDCPGKVLNNMQNAILPRGNPGWFADKMNFIRNYKFTIAIENSFAPGYITEKLTQPLLCNSVPIYLGAPDVSKYYNSKAFINLRDFASFDEAARYVEFLDNDDQAYLDMLFQPAMSPEFDPQKHDLKEFLLQIAANLKEQPKNVFPYSSVDYLMTDLASVRDNLIVPLAEAAGMVDVPLSADLGRDKAFANSPLTALADGVHKGQTPPKTIPSDMMAAFTMNGAVPVLEWYFDESQIKPAQVSRETYDKKIAQVRDRSLSLYKDTFFYLMNALDAFPVEKKSVLIPGYQFCACDAVALANGAEQVMIVDERPPACEHEKVRVADMAAFARGEFQADAIISVSVINHAGLGRFGDALDADGDLKHSRQLARNLRKGGILFLSFSVGRDCLVWNAHRVYGSKRLPELLAGWTFLSSWGLDAAQLDNLPLGAWTNQPVFVLTNDPLAVNIPDSATLEQQKEIRTIAASGSFDHDYYMRAYPLALAGKMDLISHYVLLGAEAGLKPNRWFDAEQVRAKMPASCSGSVNPFFYYLTHIGDLADFGQ